MPAINPHSTIAAIKRIDRIIGERIRIARHEAGMSQTDLGGKLGLTFQQVQKYEKGTNRVSPGKLAVIADLTGKNVSWFYQGIGEGTGGDINSSADTLMSTRLGARLVAAFLVASHEDQFLTVTIAEDFARRAARPAELRGFAQAAE